MFGMWQVISLLREIVSKDVFLDLLTKIFVLEFFYENKLEILFEFF